MNRKLNKLITSLMMVLVLSVIVPLGQMTSWADETRIAFSDPSVMVGNQVTVNMKVTSDKALGTATIMLSYDSNNLKFVSGTNANGGAGAIKVLGTMDSTDQKVFSFSLKFKALQAGSTQIKVTSQEVYNVDGETLNVGKVGNSSVKVTSPATYSKDAALKTLKISPGTLSPEFSASVINYTAQVDGSTENLVVNADAANAGAKVTLKGDKGLKTGENEVVVTVTAEDRETVKNYTIVVTKAESEAASTTGENIPVELGEDKVTILNKEYSVAKSFDESMLPDGFEAEKYQYKGHEIMAGKGLKKDIRLIYLQGPDEKGSFYIYNEGADSWSPYIQLEGSSNSIVLMPLDSDTVVPDNFVETQVTINDVQVEGWKLSSEEQPEYCFFYAMNGNGEKYFYCYDLTEKTIQRYFVTGVSVGEWNGLRDKYNDLVNDYQIQFYILIAVSVFALILLIIVIVLVRKGNSARNDWSSRDGYGRGRSGGVDTDPYYDDEDEDISSNRVRRYSREEYDDNEYADVQIDPEYFEDEVDKQDYEEDDDFIIEESLDDMERKLHEGKGEPLSGEEDDFEFIDLDD